MTRPSDILAALKGEIHKTVTENAELKALASDREAKLAKVTAALEATDIVLTMLANSQLDPVDARAKVAELMVDPKKRELVKAATMLGVAPAATLGRLTGVVDEPVGNDSGLDPVEKYLKNFAAEQGLLSTTE